MSASAEAPAEAHGEDSLLSLAREFEQHLGRLSRGSAGEQGRGDGLRARNEQLRERAGLAPASPAKDVEAGAGVAPSSPPTRAEGAAAAPRGAAVEAAAPTPSRPGGALREPLLGHGARQASPSAASGADSTASAGNRLPSVTRLPSQVLHGKVSRSRLQEYASRGSIARGLTGKRTDADIHVRSIEVDNKHVRPVAPVKAKYNQHFGTFWRNLAMSVRVAFWCALFGFPIYSQANYELFYGSQLCSPSQLGRWVVGPNGTGIVPHEGSASTPWRPEKDVWCGYLPGMYASYWPNVIQMIIYTVYKTSGNTIMFAWQGVGGTWLAVVNIYILMGVWPRGAMDAGYIPWVAWLDCLGLTFLFLISKMSTNAIKFGLSWHLFFMMGYMNPNTGPHIGELHTGIPGVQWDSEPTAVLFTTYTGSLLAVLATLFPWPMLNITRVDEDTKTVVSSLDNIWEDAISYFCGGRHAAKRLQIASKIANLTNNISTVSGDLEASWWETLDLCGFKHKRALYAELDAELDQLHQVLYAMKACILEAGFGKTHEAFMDKSMRRAAENLKLATMRLLYHCAESCRDGKVDENELKQIVQCVGEIKHCQMLMLLEYDHKLSAAYGQELNSSNPLSDEPFCNCTIFVYSLSVFAWRVSAFAEGHLEKDGSRKRGSVVRNMFGWLHESSGEADAEHRNFAIRNTMSVTLCFVMGFYLRGSVFQTGYNATMATTLALLISRYAGTTFERNTKRLIGVALGKVLPILIMGLVNRLECNSTLQILAHVLAICLYLITFEYMYFTSYQWDYVGLCAAAFGCTFFFTTCIQGGDADGQIKSNYVEIGQVILAIGVQITIDTLMKSKDTRQIATVYTHDLGQALQRGFREYFSGCDLSLSKYYLKLMKSRVAPAEEFRPMADPHNAVFPGPKTPFKHKLYTMAIYYMRLVVSDFEMICICSEAANSSSGKYSFGEYETILDFLDEMPSMEEVRLDFMSFIGLTRRGLDIILHHDDESTIMDREILELEDVEHLHKLDDMIELTDQIHQKAGHQFAHLAALEPTMVTFTVEPSAGAVQEDLGFTLVRGTSTIEKLRAWSPAARTGMSQKHIGWIVTHVNGQEVPCDRIAHTAEALGEAWRAGQALTVTAHAPRALYADPRARLLVTLQALQNARNHFGHIAALCIQENLH